MKNAVKISILSVSLIAAGVVGSSQQAFATLVEGIEQGRGTGVPTELFNSISGGGGIFSRVINTMLFIVGVLSVIMLIYGGLRYVISRGDSKVVESAKNTILYAIVGLIVAMLAYAIVRFVVSQFMDGSLGGGSNGTNGIAPTNI